MIKILLIIIWGIIGSLVIPVDLILDNLSNPKSWVIFLLSGPLMWLSSIIILIILPLNFIKEMIKDWVQNGK